LESSYSYGQPTSGPGETTSSNSNLSAAQELLKTLPVTAGTTAISLAATSSSNLPIKVVLISPTGTILQTADSANGVVAMSVPVSKSGNYVVKIINLSLGPVQVWMAATPTVKR